MSARLDISHVTLVGIGLTLKRDIAVSLVRIPVLHQSEDILQTVPPEEERQKEQSPWADEYKGHKAQQNTNLEHFALLLSVNALMVIGYGIIHCLCRVPYEYEWPDTHGQIPLERDDVIKNYFHINFVC